MSIGISQKIDSILFEWYSERGMEVPDWKMKTDPDWWIGRVRRDVARVARDEPLPHRAPGPGRGRVRRRDGRGLS